MQRIVPNLDWLRVFAAASANESFALAANELGVTPGAVSQRVRSLERFLGVQLFLRLAQGVRLTDAGRRYAESVTPALERLIDATSEVATLHTSRPVRITVLPALAQLWLGPRLRDFHCRHQRASVEIWADPNLIDIRASDFDFAIRYGKPPFPGCDHRALMLDELVLVASPAVAGCSRREGAIPTGVPLMLDSYWTDDFDTWLRHAGERPPADLVVQTFSLYSMAVEAVLAGQGFMVGHSSLVSDLIRKGLLHELSAQRAPAENQFYLLTRSSGPVSRAATVFADWLVEQNSDIAP